MADQNPQQKVDFSHYFDETKNNSGNVKAQGPTAIVKGLQGLVVKLSFGAIKSKKQANVVLVLIFLACLAVTVFILFKPTVEQQTQVTKPSPLIHPTIK